MTRDELLQKVSAAIDETLYAYSHGEMSDDMAKESILALIPPQPKLEWDKNDCLRLGTIVVGYIGLCHPEYRERKRAAVEEAVRKALLGCTND